MDGPIGTWLVGDFVLLGIHLQHWMVLVLGIGALGILVIWLTGGFDTAR
jgi:hypothetical protein